VTYIIAICVDHKENVVANLTNRLHSDFTVLATIVLSLKCGTQEDASSIFEAETSFFEGAAALGFVPLEEHCPMYALSVVWSRDGRQANFGSSDGLGPCDFKDFVAHSHPKRSLCTLRHGRHLPQRNTRYQAGATPYLDRTFTGWIAPASPGAPEGTEKKHQ